MQIIILGAGQVGAGMARSLSAEDFDITVVDIDAERLRELQERLDIRTVHGHAAHPGVLEQAGIQDADLLIALTSSDETNMVACQVAWTLYSTPTKVARVRADAYLAHPGLFDRDNTPIDVLISPEQLVMRHVQRLIEYPGALQVLDFAGGRAQMVAMRAAADGPLAGLVLRQLRQLLPAGVEVRVAAIFRAGRALELDGNTRMETDDTVFFLAARDHVPEIMRELGRMSAPGHRILLAGGGMIGASLARRLESDHHVKVIERNPVRAAEIAESLDTSLVLVGNCADGDLLHEEGIEETDVFCALTNDDEANILSSMLARRLGAGKVITLINRSAYVDLVGSDRIDVAVSPQQITVGALLTHIRKGHVVRVHSLMNEEAEAIEAVAHGTPGLSPVVGRRIGELGLPPATVVGGLVRGEQLIIAHHDIVIEDGDHVILFVAEPSAIRRVEQLFSVQAVFV